MEILSCHSNQTKKNIFQKKQQKKHKLITPQAKDATDEIWAQLAKWLQRRCRLKVLTDEDDGQLPII